MSYLLPAEYAAFGLATDTADELVTMASTLIAAHCKRATLMVTEYVERVRFSEGAQTARLSYGPIGSITAVRVRFGRGRRGDLADLLPQGIMGFQVASAFGLPGTWSTLDPATVDVYATARELTFPYNLLGLAYNEAEITYTAGFVTVPVQIKAACAQIVKNTQNTPGLNVKTSRLDTMQMEYFAGSLIDDDVRRMLKSYVAEKLG
jgi:hypothetical protein